MDNVAGNTAGVEPKSMSAAPDFAPRFIESKGARLRVAVFEAKAPRGVCVLLSGQTEFIEKYFEVIDELRGRGFSVATMDWRGQGGSDRLLPNPREGHVGDFSDYDADLNALMENIVTPMLADGEAPIALAHSMGGHILLRALHARSSAFSACVLSGPMIRISSRGEPAWLVPLVSAVMNAIGRSKDFVFGMAHRDALTLPFARQIVTSDPARFARTRDFLEAHPDLRINGPSWGWLAAAFRSMAEINAPGYAQAITTPVLIIGAGTDRICLSGAAENFATRMPKGRYLEIAGAEHEMLMEQDSIRAQFWNAFDAFIGAKK